jgi:hypothetical protein
MKKPPESNVDLVDHGFMEARAKLLDIAAFLDRLERHNQADDYRVRAFCESLKLLDEPGADRAAKVLLALSDPSEAPIAEAHTKGAAGAYSPEVDM